MSLTATTDDLAVLSRRVAELTDRVEIAELCDRYTANLDKNRGSDDWLPSVFTEDAHLTFPMGEYKGLAGLAAFQQMARTTFERTHHISANYAIRLDGDRAEVAAHLTAVHVRRREEPDGHFAIGGHYDAEVVRTPQGWRISRFVFDLVWRAGEPPAGKV
ncbi:nuclear transport factor 2 family protein [Streptomyces sp. NPDC015346]|uniref:nuclear transport factor 2 family protein n=1 Tax=Streptomyces sp. NPDC015346 TaxID=3364954 RepID=UPI0036FED815